MNSMKLNKVIFFDLDGVILDTESIYLKLMLEYNRKMNIEITREYYIKNLLGKTKLEISKYLSEKFEDKFEFEQYWSQLEEIRENYILNNKIKIKCGFLELMQFLKKNDYEFGIVTSNSKRLAIELLEKSGLMIEDFKFIITRENVINPKPASDLYNEAMKKIKNDDYSFIAIEDSTVGIESALGAGIEVIYVEDIDIVDPELKSKCLTSLKSLNDVIKLLKEMK